MSSQQRRAVSKSRSRNKQAKDSSKKTDKNVTRKRAVRRNKPAKDDVKDDLTDKRVAMVRFEHVSKRYPGGRDALSGIDFTIAPGEFVFLTGHSGAGKSTLLKVMTAVEQSTRGRVAVDGQDLNRLNRRLVPYFRRKIGVVYQDHKLLEDYSVFDNVALPLMVGRAQRRDIERRVRAALGRVGLLDRERLLPRALSGGEQQRVGIARAIVNHPHLILADEPTGNLDPTLADEIMTLFRDLNRHKVTVLVATHDPRHFANSKARVLELQDGALVKDSRQSK